MIQLLRYLSMYGSNRTPDWLVATAHTNRSNIFPCKVWFKCNVRVSSSYSPCKQNSFMHYLSRYSSSGTSECLAVISCSSRANYSSTFQDMVPVEPLSGKVEMQRTSIFHNSSWPTACGLGEWGKYPVNVTDYSNFHHHHHHQQQQ